MAMTVFDVYDLRAARCAFMAWSNCFKRTSTFVVDYTVMNVRNFYNQDLKIWLLKVV